MSPLASGLHTGAREAGLAGARFVFETQWESLEAHDESHAGDAVRRISGTLESILTSVPFEVLYDGLIETEQPDNVAI